MKKILFCLILSGLSLIVQAGEGMWLPLLLQQLNETEMKAMGMKMSAEDIYSVNKGSLKDAIVHFGGFCTAEVISDQGLLLTNFHCGRRQIQSHTSLENNHLEHGFWAKSRSEELPNPGLFARFIVRIEDVSEQALKGVTDEMSETERQSAIDQNLSLIKASMTVEQFQDIMIRPFFEGNQYFLFVTETYNDVRLVGSPPAAIGEFGKDTDNWVWPRHAADFSLFRIYAGPDNKPAEYSPDNVPLKPKHFLPISLDGISEDDFTLVFGFPGRTHQYLPAVAMEMRVDVLNPIKIGIRDKALAIIDEAMRNDPEVKIQYASKQASIANSWKKWKGESLGVKTTDGVGKKKQREAEFSKRVEGNPAWKKDYGSILEEFDALYAHQKPYAITLDYVGEITGRTIELFRLVNYVNRYYRIYANSGYGALYKRAGQLQGYLEDFYKNYRPDIDEKVFAALMKVYFTEVDPMHQSQYARDQFDFAGEDIDALAKAVYEKSMLTKGDLTTKHVQNNLEEFMKALEGDYAFQLVNEITKTNNRSVMVPYNTIQEKIDRLQRQYMKAQMEVFPEERFYPDANSTMRVTYGKVAGYTPRDAVEYQPVTYLSGVMEKYHPGDYEFDVPEKLRQLYQEKDYGDYAENGEIPVCFIGTNHTSGGNSGSPAIDAHGNLVGLNFDRVWEGTMSDINYDPSICRNIMVDIRYVLFIIDKFAGAKNIIEELKLVHPKE